MFVVLDRRIKMPEFTVGDWIIDGKKLCDTMEDCDRGLHQSMPLAEIKAKKVYGETAIPAGRYKIKITFSPKYKRMMPQIMNVPGFDGIRVHSGNSSKDSLGCVLLVVVVAAVALYAYKNWGNIAAWGVKIFAKFF